MFMNVTWMQMNSVNLMRTRRGVSLDVIKLASCEGQGQMPDRIVIHAYLPGRISGRRFSKGRVVYRLLTVRLYMYTDEVCQFMRIGRTIRYILWRAKALHWRGFLGMPVCAFQNRLSAYSVNIGNYQNTSDAFCKTSMFFISACHYPNTYETFQT